jgi:hypothetical protein
LFFNGIQADTNLAEATETGAILNLGHWSEAEMRAKLF